MKYLTIILLMLLSLSVYSQRRIKVIQNDTVSDFKVHVTHDKDIADAIIYQSYSTHITKNKKDYIWKIVKRSPDYTVIFVPHRKDADFTIYLTTDINEARMVSEFLKSTLKEYNSFLKDVKRKHYKRDD